MRIVCDGCQAKYSIADDKVRAKVFKIRCKKCSNVIVVRGEAATEPAVVEPAVEDDAIWHLVIDQEQVGPMTAREVEARFASGAIEAETFTWREGMEEWLPLVQLDAFAALTGQATPAATTPVTRAPARDSELFATAASSGLQVAETAAQRLRGERNESSVLFSLGNLAQIANHRPAPAAGAATKPDATPGMEGSGLIDIRSMASAYLGSPTTAAKSPSAGIGSIDDLPVFGGGGFSEPAVLVPAARPATSSKLLYVMIGAMALLATAAIILMIMLVGNKHPDVSVAQPPAPPPVQVAVVQPPAPPPAPAPAPAPVVAPAAPAIAPTNHNERHHEPAAPYASPASHAVPPTAHHAAPVAVPAPLQAAPKDTCDQISCVVNSDSPCCVKLLGGGAHKPDKIEIVDPSLPPKLVVSQVTSSMAGVKAKIMACGDRSSAKGTVKVHLKVAGDGHVSDANVETAPDAALGACVAAAAKRATFPKTQTGGSFGIPYVF